MGRRKITFYVNKVQSQPLKGRGWIDISIEVAKRLGIPFGEEQTNSRYVTKITLEDVEYESLKSDYSLRRQKMTRGFWLRCENEDGSLDIVVACNRGKAGGKKFTVVDSRETVKLIVQKNLTIQAVCAWVKTWASVDAEIITPGGKTISLDGDHLNDKTEFVYFIYSEESNAIKIGRANNVKRRLKSLQTAHPHELKVIKTFKVRGGKAAQELENTLHQKFDHLRLSGEWFKAEQELFDFEI